MEKKRYLQRLKVDMKLRGLSVNTQESYHLTRLWRAFGANSSRLRADEQLHKRNSAGIIKKRGNRNTHRLPLFLIRTDIKQVVLRIYRKGYKKFSKGYVKGYNLKKRLQKTA